MHFGFGHGYWLRASGSTHAGYEIQVLRVMRGGRPVALLFNHPTHPVRGPLQYGTSHPGYAMDEVEAQFPGALALYADACGGNQSPVPLAGLDPLSACRRRGHDLAQEVVRIAKGPLEEVTGPIESQLKLVAIQGEPCATLGARIKDVLRQSGPVMMFGYFAERNLYIPAREHVRQNAYQAQVIQIQFGSPVGWAPNAEDEMVKAVLALHGEKYME